MQQNPLAFDADADKNEAIRKHGSVLGRLVSADQATRRHDEDVRHAELSAKLPSVTAQTSQMQHAASITQADYAARREQLHAAFATDLRKIDDDAEQARRQSEAAVAALVSESLGMQREMLAITERRQAERETRAVAAFNAPGMEHQREVERNAAAAASAERPVPFAPGTTG